MGGVREGDGTRDHAEVAAVVKQRQEARVEARERSEHRMNVSIRKAQVPKACARRIAPLVGLVTSWKLGAILM